MFKLGVKRLAANFISLVFLTLVIAIYFGFTISIRSVTSNLNGALNYTIERYNLEDFEITSSLGFDDYSFKSIKDIDGVDEVNMGSIYDLVDDVGNVLHLTTINLHQDINKIELREGRLPISDNEVVVEAIGNNSYEIGDVITLADREDSILSNYRY